MRLKFLNINKIWIGLGVTVSVSLAGCAKVDVQSNPVTKQSFYFDTVCQVTIYDMVGMSVEAATKTIDDSFASCAEYESILSKTIEGSDVWNVNHASGQAVSVDPCTMEVIKMGIQYGDLTDGAFDITIGQAEDLWDFHAKKPVLPDEIELKKAVEHVDYRTIVVDETDNTVRLQDPDAEIDLGGIAKGYIADRVADQLRNAGVTSAIISLGGNIECVGGKINADSTKKEQKDFVIGIETPYSDMTQIVGATNVTDGTVVTSGVYERYFEINGQEYHHILDPLTGYPVETDVVGVSIRSDAGHSADCDALSTTSLILGSSKAMSLLESLDGYEAVFILKNGNVITTSGMDFASTSK